MLKHPKRKITIKNKTKHLTHLKNALPNQVNKKANVLQLISQGNEPRDNTNKQKSTGSLTLHLYSIFQNHGHLYLLCLLIISRMKLKEDIIETQINYTTT